MDPALKEAAKTGNVKFLKEAFSKQPSEYFLTQCSKTKGETVGGNIFHLAAWSDQVEFIREARNILPVDIQKQLLFDVEVDFNQTPLHAAAVKSDASYDMVKVIKQMHALFSWNNRDGLVKPWLALTLENMTPLHQAMKDDRENEKCAMEILLMDSGYVSCTISDVYGNTPLIYALKNNFNLVAEKILKSPLPRTAISSSTPFTYATGCSENVMRLLFKTCGQWLDKIDSRGYSILHEWAEIGVAGPCKLLLEGGGDVGDARNKLFRECIFKKENKASNTPLHLAARNKDSELGQILVRGYQQQVSVAEGENKELVAIQCPPWKVTNILGNTPLHSALYANSKHEELALEILSIDPTLCNILNNKGESPFFLAVESGCSRVVDEIMKIEEPCYPMIHRNDGTTVVHCLSSCPEETGRMLLDKYWWIINLRDDKGKKALDYARQSNTLWLINLLTDPSLLQKYENPLHHVKLPTYKDYLNFLKLPPIAELKNTIDYDGATPLHRALERKDKILVKILLLDDKVDRTIPDNNCITAIDLLAKLCKENYDWEKMCKLIGVNPYLKTTFHKGYNLDQTRNTLSIVAALLATITFTAGFTLPGGVNGATGEPLLAKKGAFLVFLLADVYAMCVSMWALFLLTWSAGGETIPEDARIMVEQSLTFVTQSLYCTLLAFMTGIYSVIAHSSLWIAIVIIIMCSSIASWVSMGGKVAKMFYRVSPIWIRAKHFGRPMQKETHLRFASDLKEMEIIIS